MGSGKTIKKQQLRGSDAFSVLGVLSLVCYIFVYVLANNSGDKQLDTAKIDMESLSAQIMAAGMKSLPAAQSRGLASLSQKQAVEWIQNWDYVGTEGKIGKDPWGQPFHYLVVKSGVQKAKFIVIVSGGPDGLLETPVEKIRLSSSGASVRVGYLGDDFGLVRSVP